MITTTLNSLDQLIREEKTGNSIELASKAGITQNQLRAFIQFMKDCEGVLIWFDKKRNTFYYVSQNCEN